MPFWCHLQSSVNKLAFPNSGKIWFYGVTWSYNDDNGLYLFSFLTLFSTLQLSVQIFSTHPLMESYCNLDNSSSVLDNFTDSYSDVAYNSSNMTGNTYFGTYSMDSDHLQFSKPVNQPNTALLSLILTMGTFLIAYFLRIFRNSKFLGRSVSKLYTFK